MTDETIIYAAPVARTVGVDFPPVRRMPRTALRRVLAGRRVTLFLAHSEVTRDA